MSYMGQAAFMPASGIQELSFDEIDYVNGAATTAVVAVVIVAVIFLAGVAAGFAAEHNRDTSE